MANCFSITKSSLEKMLIEQKGSFADYLDELKSETEGV